MAVASLVLADYRFGKLGTGGQHILRPYNLVTVLFGADAFEVENRRGYIVGEGGRYVVHCSTSFIVSKKLIAPHKVALDFCHAVGVFVVYSHGDVANSLKYRFLDGCQVPYFVHALGED